MKKICPGFTLVELLVVISIMGILFSIGMVQYMRFNRQQILRQSVFELETNLNQARNMALVGKKECTGTFDGILVQFSGDKNYTISSSCNNKTVLVSIATHQFTQEVERTGGPGEILFKTLTGGTDLGSEATVTLEAFDYLSGGVKVAPSGKIEVVF